MPTRLNHTMLRIRNPNASLKFYRDHLGMEVIGQRDFADAKFSLYFLSFPGTDTREGILELTHNHGTESDPKFAGYHDGNSDPRGFGHICITVDSLEQSVADFDAAGYEFVKRPEDGQMRHLAFVKDPDGYWIEVVEHDAMRETLTS
ncbi:MAG: lactoylglutathione lyase [Litorimonas sp.]